MISLLMPTRKRVKRANAFMQSIVDTADDLTRIEIIAAIDQDDQESQMLCSPSPQLTLIKTIGARDTMGALNTRCLQQASGKLIMAVNDDILIRSPHWDTYLLDAIQPFSDELYLLHTRDGFKDEKFAIFPVLSRKAACLLIQNPFPACYVGDGIDAHLFDIFIRLKDLGWNRILYVPTVFFEHLHYGLGKGEYDENYQNRSARVGNQKYHALWQYREQLAHYLAAYLSNPTLPTQPPPAIISQSGNNIKLMIDNLLYTKQSWSYRLKQFCYHLAREIYITFGIHHLKSWIKRRLI